MEDLDGKLDRLELNPLKEWMEARLKALNDKLKKYQQTSTEYTEDDAAGIRKYETCVFRAPVLCCEINDQGCIILDLSVCLPTNFVSNIWSVQGTVFLCCMCIPWIKHFDGQQC